MEEQIIKTILTLSAAGGCLGLLFWLLKPIFSRLFGSTFQFYMWLLVFVLLLTPLRIEFKTAPAKRYIAQSVEIIVQTNGEKPSAQDKTTAGAETANPFETAVVHDDRRHVRRNGWEYAFYAWLLGFIFFLLFGGISYVRFLRKIRNESEVISCPAANDVRQKLHIRRTFSVRRAHFQTPPLMAGLLRPFLLLPDREFSESEFNGILLHELTHFKRFDLWFKWFAFLANAVHWFNPLVYAAVRQMQISCEFSCDIAAVKDMTEKEKKDYMRTILKLAEKEEEKHV